MIFAADKQTRMKHAFTRRARTDCDALTRAVTDGRDDLEAYELRIRKCPLGDLLCCTRRDPASNFGCANPIAQIRHVVHGVDSIQSTAAEYPLIFADDKELECCPRLSTVFL